MTRGADFSTYEPVKFGVSAQPLCVVIKYKDRSTRGGTHKHHLIKLERLIADGIEALSKDRVLRFLQRHHWQYFEGKVDKEMLDTVISKVMTKAREPPSKNRNNSKERGKDLKNPPESDRYDFKRKPEASPSTTKPNKGDNEVPKDRMSPSASTLQAQRRQSIKKEPSIQEEDIEEDFLNSEDLGLESNKYGDIKKSGTLNNNSKPGLDNGSAIKLSDSRISNEPLPSLNKPAKKGGASKYQEPQKAGGDKAKKGTSTLSKSDEFQDEFLDGFDSVDKRSATLSNSKLVKSGKLPSVVSKPVQEQSVPKPTKPVVQEDDYLDGFEDDFDAVDAKKSISLTSKKNAAHGKDNGDDDGFDDLDFEDIPDEVSNEANKRGKKDEFDDFDDIAIDIGMPGQPSKAQMSTFPTSNVRKFDLKEIEKLDLNKLTDEEVSEIKKTMDLKFQALKPGDPGYVYEKNQSFVAEESNDWDD